MNRLRVAAAYTTAFDGTIGTWAIDDYVPTLLMAGLDGALGFGVRELAISPPEEMIDDEDHDA